MNKKLKLILSCFCLCLTLGIMSVAVWAATTTNYTLSNTISYQIEDVYVRVQTKLYKKSTAGMVSQEELITQVESLEGKKHSEITGVTLVETYDEFKTYDGKSAINPSTTGCNCDIAYDTSAENPAFAYYIVMEIENYASDPIHAYLLNNTPLVDLTRVTADVFGINSHLYFTSNLVRMEGNSITSLVIGYALRDTTISLSETQSPFVLQINEGEYNPEDFMTFTEVTDDSGTVTGYEIKGKDSTMAGPLVIPGTYNGLPVTFYESGRNGAFSGFTNLTSVTIKEGVKNLGKLCFSGGGMIKVVLPSSLTGLGSYTFRGCENLVSINIPNNVTILGDSLFDRCLNLEKIDLPESITSIGKYVFEHCLSLKSIEISPNTETIGNGAFSRCYNLKSITIPQSVISIGTICFYTCWEMISISIEGATATNWGYADSADATEWTTIDLTNPETNVNYFAGTYTGMYFKKIG